MRTSFRCHGDLPYLEILPSVRLRWHPAEICDISCTIIWGFLELRLSWLTSVCYVRFLRK